MTEMDWETPELRDKSHRKREKGIEREASWCLLRAGASDITLR